MLKRDGGLLSRLLVTDHERTGQGGRRNPAQMTFLEVVRALPNGFHDAELHRFEMDYVGRTLRFDLVVWIGDMDDRHARERYRPARLTLTGVGFLVIEPPDANCPWSKQGCLRIDAGEGTPAQGASLLPEAPAGTPAGWFYLEEFNRFLHFSAAEASLEWSGPEEIRS